MVNPDVDVHIKTGNHRKAQKNNLLITKIILNTEIYAKCGPGFYIYLARGSVSTPAPRQLHHCPSATCCSFEAIMQLRDAGKRGHSGRISPCPLKRWATWAEVSFS